MSVILEPLTGFPADNPSGCPLIGWHNLASRTNVTSTLANLSFPVANLTNPATHLKWVNGANPGAPALPTYFLRSDFASAANQTWSNGQLVNSTTEGMIDGSIRINNLGSGTIGITSGVLAAAPGGGGNVMMWFGMVPRTKALAFHIRFSVLNTTGNLLVGPIGRVASAGSASTPEAQATNARGMLLLNGGSIGYAPKGLSPTTTVGTYTSGGVGEYLWLMGGSDSNGIPWDGSADFSNYLYGKSLYSYESSQWVLLTRDLTEYPDDDYNANGPAHAMGLFFDAGAAASCSHMNVKDEDHSSAFVATFRLISPALNATATGTADEVLEAKITRPSAGTMDVSFRYTDDNNRWYWQVNSSGDLKLFEVASSVTTQRGTTAAAVVPSGSSVITAYIDGASIRVFNGDMTANTAYASAATGLAVTGHKVSSLGTGGSISYLASWPRRGYSFTIATAVPLTGGRNTSDGVSTAAITYVGDSLLDGEINGLGRSNTPMNLQHMLGGNWDGSNFFGSRWRVFNRGVGGTGISNLVSDISNVVATWSASNVANVLIIHSATNDIANFPAAPGSIEAAMQSYITQVRAAAVAAGITNLTILLHSVLKRNDNPWGGPGNAAQHQADRLIYNAAMQTWSGNNGVLFISLDNDTRLTDPDDTRYFRKDTNSPISEPQAVHLNHWGQGILARQDFDALTSLQYAYINIAVNATVDYVAVARHNFGSQAIPVSIEVASSNSPSDYVEVIPATTPTDDNPLIFRFSPRSASSVRLKLSVVNAQIAPQAAVIYAGEILVLERSITIGKGHVPIPYGRRSNIVNGMSETGNFLGRIVLGEYRESKAEFEWFTPEFYRSDIDDFLAAAQEVPFFWAWAPEEYPNETGYCWLTNDAEPEVDPATRRIALTLEMRGVA